MGRSQDIRNAQESCMTWDDMAIEAGFDIDTVEGRRAAREKLGDRPFGPNRIASARCESGKRNYCTCDTCF